MSVFVRGEAPAAESSATGLAASAIQIARFRRLDLPAVWRHLLQHDHFPLHPVASVRLLTRVLLGAALAFTGNTHSADDADTLLIPASGWRLVTDGVMGGISSGTMRHEEREGRACVCLAGDVSTANNGGFIQIALDLDDDIAARAADYDGVALQVLGNGEAYNVHLRSSDLWLPWQSYRAGFVALADWSAVRLPFSGFEPYKTGSSLRPERLKRIGLVAIGRDFKADVCVADLAFYRDS